MSRRSRRLPARLAACALSLGCASPPEESPRWPELAPLAAEQQSGPVSAPAPPAGALRTGLAWTEDWVGDPGTYDGALGDLRRQQREIVERFAGAFGHPPVGEVRPLRAGGAPGDDPVPAVLAQAAQDGRDLVIVLRTTTAEEVTANALSPLFLLVPLTPFLPGYHLRVLATADACALDVGTGEALACRSAHAQQADGWITPLGRRGRHRELRLAVLGTAVEAVARGLLVDVRRWSRRAPPLLGP